MIASWGGQLVRLPTCGVVIGAPTRYSCCATLIMTWFHDLVIIIYTVVQETIKGYSTASSRTCIYYYYIRIVQYVGTLLRIYKNERGKETKPGARHGKPTQTGARENTHTEIDGVQYHSDHHDQHHSYFTSPPAIGRDGIRIEEGGGEMYQDVHSNWDYTSNIRYSTTDESSPCEIVVFV